MKRRYYTITIIASLLTCNILQSCSGKRNDNTQEQPAQHRDIEVVVHRGANALAPENTIASADSALAHGAKWIEVDVRTTQDSVMYNLHDATLDRTTDGKGFIYNHTAQEIDLLDAGAWYDTKFRGLRVPTIAQMLDALHGRAYIYFDVKDCYLPDLIRLVRDKGYTDRSFFWFGQEDMLREFVSLAPDMKVKVNAADTTRLQYWQTICQPAIVEVHADKLTPEFQKYCRDHNIRTMVGAQGESLEDYRKAIETGADMINLDRPEIFECL